MDPHQEQRPKWARDERADDDLEMIPEDGQAQNAPTGPDPTEADSDPAASRDEAERR